MGHGMGNGWGGAGEGIGVHASWRMGGEVCVWGGGVGG